MTTLRLRARDPSPLVAKASYFELFYDLVFVAAIAQMGAWLVDHYDGDGLLRHAFVLLILWWAWIGQTFYLNRFGTDDGYHRVTGVAQMVALVFIGFAAPEAFGSLGAVFALAVATFKAVLVLEYWNARRVDGAAVLARTYVVAHSLSGLLFVVSAPLDPQLRVALWGVALLVDLLTPLAVTRHTHALPLHGEHLPERFSLFTIIVFGEAVVALIHGLAHDPHLSLAGALAATVSMVVVTMFWWAYFVQTRASSERSVRDRSEVRRLQAWAYAHLPLNLGLTILAAGLMLAVQAIGHGANLPGGPALLVGTALTMLALSLLGISNDGRPLAAAIVRRAPGLAIVATLLVVAIARPQLTIAAGFALSLVAVVLQVGLARLWLRTGVPAAAAAHAEDEGAALASRDRNQDRN